VLQEPFEAFSTTGRHPPFAYGLTVELVHLRSFNKSLTATHSTESKRSVFLAARSAMTFDLTGGETGEARLLDLLDLLFCLVTRRLIEFITAAWHVPAANPRTHTRCFTTSAADSRATCFFC
jgi:hypothetical protein